MIVVSRYKGYAARDVNVTKNRPFRGDYDRVYMLVFLTTVLYTTIFLAILL
jgi:hypothetical protein